MITQLLMSVMQASWANDESTSCFNRAQYWCRSKRLHLRLDVQAHKPVGKALVPVIVGFADQEKAKVA